MSEGKSLQRIHLKPQLDLDDASEFESLKKQAFRTAFDFHSHCFPPTLEEEYWDRTSDLMKKRIEENPDNLLLHHLVLAVYNFLGDIVKDLKQEEEKE